MDKSKIKIFLVDDHPLVREWLTNLIQHRLAGLVERLNVSAQHSTLHFALVDRKRRKAAEECSADIRAA